MARERGLDAELLLRNRFAMVKGAGVFDYYDKTPPVQDLYTYKAAAQKPKVWKTSPIGFSASCSAMIRA